MKVPREKAFAIYPQNAAGSCENVGRMLLRFPSQSNRARRHREESETRWYLAPNLFRFAILRWEEDLSLYFTRYKFHNYRHFGLKDEPVNELTRRVKAIERLERCQYSANLISTIRKTKTSFPFLASFNENRNNLYLHFSLGSRWVSSSTFYIFTQQF